MLLSKIYWHFVESVGATGMRRSDNRLLEVIRSGHRGELMRSIRIRCDCLNFRLNPVTEPEASQRAPFESGAQRWRFS
jgi:hypothetical protein